MAYRIVVSGRNFLYDRQIFKVKDVSCHVVSIGNLTLGGTGKTPVVIMTAKHLKTAGYRVAVISRGYRRRGKDPLIVSDGGTVLVSPHDAGDEPHIIASSVPDVPVVVGADRYRAAQLACERFKPDVIVLDDAFQHRRLFRNVDVMTLDAGNLCGNEYLLPRGILREPPSTLSRAKAVIITRFQDSLCRDSIERMVRYYDRKVQIFWSGHIPTGLRTPGTGSREPASEIQGSGCSLQDIRDTKVAALSNIANPDSFHRMLVSLGADIVHQHVMADHHRYTKQELELIEHESLNAGADVIVMTAKDERNLPEHYRFKTARAFVLDVEAVLLEQSDEYLKIIAPKIKS